jgi:hypothetical protein
VTFHAFAGHCAWRGMQDYLRQQRPGSRTSPQPEPLSLDAHHTNTDGDAWDDKLLNAFAVEDDHPRLVLEDVARLPPRVARCAVLYAAGFTLREIGALDGVTESRISQLIGKARLGPPHRPASGVLLVDRTLHQGERDAIREARRVRPGAKVVSLAKRKVRQGRVVAPQGRPAGDGSLGRPVWAVELRDAA